MRCLDRGERTVVPPYTVPRSESGAGRAWTQAKPRRAGFAISVVAEAGSRSVGSEASRRSAPMLFAERKKEDVAAEEKTVCMSLRALRCATQVAELFKT